MNIIEQDILEIEKGIVCHQVNCKGVMGAGLALQIRRKYPQLYAEYSIRCYSQNGLLGNVTIYEANENLIIVNMFSQYDYGRENKLYTNYHAFEKCLRQISDLHSCNKDLNIYFPFKIGCGLARGNWKEISSLINFYIPNAIICKRKGDK